MSSAFISPGQAYDHLLMAVKGYHPDYPLDRRGKLTTNVVLPTVVPHSGRVVHISGTRSGQHQVPGRYTLTSFEMGCGVNHGPPIFLWPGAYDNDVSNQGTPAGTPAVGQTGRYADWISALPGRSAGDSEQLWGLVGLPGLELESTEFDVAQTYTANNYLRCVTDNTIAAAGMITNQAASSGAGLSTTSAISGTTQTDTIIGIVSGGAYLNANDRKVLAFYTYFLPGTR